MSFTVQPCTKYLGAEIGGVDLSRTINTEIFATIDQTYAKHGVIFFRNQEISPDQ
ncbi:MAG: taurine dioxygenase, partial [Rhodospirillales bacterium]|nr:taurine dioxygenase [Rhodospirillales bacterium]